MNAKLYIGSLLGKTFKLISDFKKFQLQLLAVSRMLAQTRHASWLVTNNIRET